MTGHGNLVTCRFHKLEVRRGAVPDDGCGVVQLRRLYPDRARWDANSPAATHPTGTT